MARGVRVGDRAPDFTLPSQSGAPVRLADRIGRTAIVLYFYPRDETAGCTAEACAFRDHYRELRDLGASAVFGLSTQDSAYQREAVERLHLPFEILSDGQLEFTQALNLPTFVVQGMTLIKRLTLILRDGAIAKVFYPVFPPDCNAGEVISWLRSLPRADA